MPVFKPSPTPWAKLYGKTRWARRTRLNLRMNPMCAQCEEEGRVHEANLSHHANEYREGFSELEFWYGPLRSVCYDCHARIHGRPPKLPYEKDIDPSGWPSDPAHPGNATELKEVRVAREAKERKEQERKWKLKK